jgi:hypothetical protein
VVRLCGGEAISKLLDRQGHPVVEAEPLLGRHRQQRVEEGLVDDAGAGSGVVRFRVGVGRVHREGV